MPSLYESRVWGKRHKKKPQNRKRHLLPCARDPEKKKLQPLALYAVVLYFCYVTTLSGSKEMGMTDKTRSQRFNEEVKVLRNC